MQLGSLSASQVNGIEQKGSLKRAGSADSVGFYASKIGVNPINIFKAYYALQLNDEEYTSSIINDPSKFSSEIGCHEYTSVLLCKALSLSILRKTLLLALGCFFGQRSFYRISPSIFVYYSSDGKTNLLHLDVDNQSPLEESDKDVLRGGASAEFQVSGIDATPNSDWAHAFNDEKKLRVAEEKLELESGFLSHAIKFNTNWKQHIDEIYDAGVRHFRFSIDWSQIEPRKGEYSQEAVNRYKEMTQYIKDKGIEPHATLLHFNKPLWWAQKGGFEKEENIQDFVDFCEYITNELGDRVVEYSTINEPTIDMFMGYILKSFPPFKTLFAFEHIFSSLAICMGLSFFVHPVIGILTVLIAQLAFCSKRAAKVLKHELMAHCQVYEKIHSNTDEIGEKKVGICHQALEFEARYWFDPISQAVSHFLTNFTHKKAFEFFETGQFNFLGEKYSYMKNKEIKPAPLDFMGIQKYANCVMSLLGPTAHKGQTLTCMGFPIYPESLAQSIVEFYAARKDVPIHITENGAPSDESRKEWVEQYPYVVRALKKAGIVVEKYFYWSIFNNIEWEMHLSGEGPPVKGKGRIQFNGLKELSQLVGTPHQSNTSESMHQDVFCAR